MAAQTCPKCKENLFTWFFNEKSNLTSWSCFNCDYEAKQTDSSQYICENCESKTKTKLKDKETEYWWCSDCNITSEI